MSRIRTLGHTAGGIAVSACIAGNAHAAIVNGFEAQATTGFLTVNGTNGPASDPDQYRGTAGNGWLGGWEFAAFGANDRVFAINDVATVPFDGASGNYLRMRVVSTNSTAGRLTNDRDYGSFGGFTTDKAGVFSFVYRVDNTDGFDSTATFLRISDGGSVSSQGETWQISTAGTGTKQFVINGGGGQNISTGVNIGLGTSYAFTIISDPETQTFDVTIDTDADGSIDFSTATSLNYLQNVSEHAGNLVFTGQVDARVDPNDANARLRTGLQFSVDSISIAPIPEPSAFLLTAAGSVLITGRRKRRC